MDWGVDVINRHGVRLTVRRSMLPEVYEQGAYLVDQRRTGRPGGPTLVDLGECGIGDCVAALPAVEWLASPGEGRDHSVWVRCPAGCAFMFAGLAARVITGREIPEGWGLLLDCMAALQQAGAQTKDKYCAVEVLCELAGCRPATPRLDVEDVEVDRRPLVLIQPKSALAGKDWPLDNWLALVCRLQDAGAKVVYAHRELVDWPGPARGYTRMDAVLGSVQEMAAHVAAADLVVAPDSACFHLAAALSTPSVGLFGPTDGAAMASHYPLARVIQSPDPDDMGRIGIALVETYCREELSNGN